METGRKGVVVHIVSIASGTLSQLVFYRITAMKYIFHTLLFSVILIRMVHLFLFDPISSLCKYIKVKQCVTCAITLLLLGTYIHWYNTAVLQQILQKDHCPLFFFREVLIQVYDHVRGWHNLYKFRKNKNDNASLVLKWSTHNTFSAEVMKLENCNSS